MWHKLLANLEYCEGVFSKEFPLLNYMYLRLLETRCVQIESMDLNRNIVECVVTQQNKR